MKAKILPLDGKYYGTEVEIKYGEKSEGSTQTSITEIWIGYGAPSIRELTKHGVTQEQWDANAIIPGTNETAQQVLDICDSHYETSRSLKAAELFVEAINGYDRKELA